MSGDPRPTPIPVADAAARTWDAIVVGAGPAGALAALRLARAGAAVLLADRRPIGRDKACGDALIPDALACLARNALLDRVRALAHPSHRATIYGPSGRAVEIESEALTLRRAVLDAELATAAVEAGATLVRATVERVDEAGAAGALVRVAGEARPLRARLAIVATGANATTLAACGLLEREAPSAVAIRTYLRSDAPLDGFVVSFDRRILPGYAWAFPMGDGTFNVGVGVVAGARGSGDGEAGLRRMLDDFLAHTPVGRALAAGERSRARVRGALIRFGLAGARPWSGGAIVAVGEAIGATYPLTGEGIGKSMETAELAADAALDALRTDSLPALAAYPRALDARLRPKYRAYGVAQRWIARPWLADLVFLRAQRSARVRRGLEGMLRETVDPSVIFSPRGVVAALLG